MVDEMERSVHDALCVVKRVLESKMVVPGGGAVEAALSIYLENFATSLVRLRHIYPFQCHVSGMLVCTEYKLSWQFKTIEQNI